MINQKRKINEAFKAWLPFAVIIIIFAGLAYVAVQQNYRLSANDPQIQIAEDVSTAINAGTAAPDAIVPPSPTQDITQSLSPFVAIYNATGTPIGSSVALDGKLPTLPSGIFDNAKAHGEDRFTWQPKPGLRVAAVVSHFNGPVPGFVMAGRSLKEIENRIKNLTLMTAIATALALVLTFLALLFVSAGNETHYRATETIVDVVSEEKNVN